MKTPIKWIQEFVPKLNTTDQEFADKMTIFGSKVETFEKLNKGFDKVVVGKILKIEKHPDADKLVVCSVDIGETTQIVTAAKNVFEGALVPVVLPGGFVSGENGEIINIKKGKLRGIESFGMFCSIHELGFNTEFFSEAPDDGIYILDNAEVGDKIDSYLGLDDTVFEYEITSNRVDCFSIYGLAREAAAAFNTELLPYKVKEYIDSSTDIDKYISVEVKNKELCKRYIAKVVTDIKVEQSPEWLRRKLMSVGIRPINNIVDITNYVMQELGQPMHAFDLDFIEGNKIIVDNANTDSFITLDEVERKLDSTVLMINDINKPLAIAGIMGGNNSKINENTKNIVFESACFDGTNIRLSSKKIGLRTDSSTKFEKGLDPNNAIIAINKACSLIEELGCGKIVSGIIDIYDNLSVPKKVHFNLDECNKMLGTNICIDDAKRYFDNLELSWNIENNQVMIPTFRQDLELFADLVEEVARSYGYDNIPVTIPKNINVGKNSKKIINQNLIAGILNSMGYSEIMTYSFEGKSVFNKLLLDEDDHRRNTVNILNPLGEEFAVMRTLPYNGMLISLKNNIKNRVDSSKLFEFANTYIPTCNKLPDEKLQICIGNYNSGDFFEIKGVIETLLSGLGLKEKMVLSTDYSENYLHPGRQAKIIYDETIIGEIGEIHPDVMENFDINKRIYIATVDYMSIVNKIFNTSKYRAISKYPTVNRDLCFVLDCDISVIEIEKVFDKLSKNLLQSYELFDIYQGENLGTGKKSVAYKLIFQSSEKTLADDDVNPIVNKIIKELSKIGIELRQ